MDRRPIADAALVVAVAASVLSVLSTWTRSGLRDRNGFATLESLDRLDLLDPPWDLALVVVTAAVPAFFALAVVGAAVERRWLLVLGALCAGAVLVAWAVVVLRSPLRSGPGPALALTSAIALLVTTSVSMRAQRRQK